MGKGDRKTKKGKIWKGTHGVSRPRKEEKHSDPKVKKK
jgi:30S ribosomal protein S31